MSSLIGQRGEEGGAADVTAEGGCLAGQTVKRARKLGELLGRVGRGASRVLCHEMAGSRTVCRRALSLQAALGNRCILPNKVAQGGLFKKRRIQLTYSARTSLAEEWNKISFTGQPFGTSHTTVDLMELKKFQLLARKWWDENGEYSALHSMNDIRVPFIRDIVLNMRNEYPLGSPLSGLKILDIGCGGGLLSEPLGRLGASVTGIDPLEDNIRTAELHKSFDPALAKRIQYKSCLLEDLVEEASETFDIIVASEVVEHVADVEMFVRCCSEVLKPEGSIFITTINKTQLSYIFGIVVAEKVLGIVPAGTHEWEKFIAPEELERILESNGFSVKTVKGMLYNPLFGSWGWIGSTSINYALHAVKSCAQEQSVPSEPPEDTDKAQLQTEAGIGSGH